MSGERYIVGEFGRKEGREEKRKNLYGIGIYKDMKYLLYYFCKCSPWGVS